MNQQQHNRLKAAIDKQDQLFEEIEQMVQKSRSSPLSQSESRIATRNLIDFVQIMLEIQEEQHQQEESKCK